MKTTLFYRQFTVIFTFLSFFSCSSSTKQHALAKDAPGGIYEGAPTGAFFPFPAEKDSAQLNTSTNVPFSEFSYLSFPNQNGEVLFVLNEAGTKHFAELSERNLEKPLYIVIGKTILMAPKLMSPITEGKLTLSGSKEDIQLIRDKLIAK